MKNILSIFAVLVNTFAFSQLDCQSQRYISEVFTDHTFDGGIQFGSDDPYGVINNQNLYLDVYQPLGDTLEKRPVIVHQFGGGYLIGWRSEPNIPVFADKYTKRGFVFISIDYRIGFNVADSGSAERAVYRGIVDFKAALRYIVDNADTYGIDTNQIFLTGTSAGSISAMGQTYMDENDRPSSTFGTLLEPTDLGCIDCTGNNNHSNSEVAIKGIISNWGAVVDTSVINPNIDPKDSVPLISFHGTADNAVFYVEGSPFSVPYFPNMQGSFLIHKRMDNLGIKNKLVPLVGFGHEPQLLNPDITDTIVIYGSQFIYEIMQGKISKIIGDSTVCLNDENTYSVPYAQGSTYCWNISNGTILNENNNTITIKWNTIGNQYIEVNELTKIEVNKYRKLNVDVVSAPNVVVNYSSNDGFFEFTSNTISNANYFWSFGDSTNSNIQNPSHQYNDTGNYTVVLNVNDDYCSVFDTTEIISDICPQANFTIFVDDSFAFITNNSQFYDNIHYNFGDGNYSNNEINTITYENEGIYTIQQIIYNDFCIDTFEQTVEIVFCAKADFNFTNNDLNVSFINTSFNNVASFWNFGDGSTNGTENPNHNYLYSGNYDVQLIVYSNELCSDTIIKTIYVAKDTSTSIIEQNKYDYSIYPNPSSGLVYIKNIDIKNIKVLNIFGSVVDDIVFDKYIDFTKKESGIYFIVINNGYNNKVYKLIISK